MDMSTVDLKRAITIISQGSSVEEAAIELRLDCDLLHRAIRHFSHFNGRKFVVEYKRLKAI